MSPPSLEYLNKMFAICNRRKINKNYKFNFREIPPINKLNTSSKSELNKITGLLKKMAGCCNMIKKLAITNGKHKHIQWSMFTNAMKLQFHIAAILAMISNKIWLRSKLFTILSRLEGEDPYSILKDNNGANVSVVYYCFEIDSSLDYVGESTNFLSRLKQEINQMRAWEKSSSYRKRGKDTSRLSKLGGRRGYFRFIYLPIINIGKLPNSCKSDKMISKEIRLQQEKAVIKWLKPKMNSKRMAYVSNFNTN